MTEKNPKNSQVRLYQIDEITFSQLLRPSKLPTTETSHVHGGKFCCSARATSFRVEDLFDVFLCIWFRFDLLGKYSFDSHLLLQLR